MDRKLMVKQRMGEIPASAIHPPFEVFTSGESGWYIFAPMEKAGISGTLQFPVQGKRLKREWKKLLI